MVVLLRSPPFHLDSRSDLRASEAPTPRRKTYGAMAMLMRSSSSIVAREGAPRMAAIDLSPIHPGEILREDFLTRPA
jgi:hypothetical protein